MVKRIDKLREGTADTGTGRAEDLREDGGLGMQDSRCEGCSQGLVC